MLGVIAHSRGNFIAAEKHFERALALNSTFHPVFADNARARLAAL